MALRWAFRVTLLLSPLLVAAACVSQTSAPKAGHAVGTSVSLARTSPAASTSIATDLTTQQPRTATYNCADGGMMTIENLGTSLRVLGPDGMSEDMPASPANQNSRFGAAHDAIVIGGRDALVMKGGPTPLTCTR